MDRLKPRPIIDFWNGVSDALHTFARLRSTSRPARHAQNFGRQRRAAQALFLGDWRCAYCTTFSDPRC
jgi:hypothetical protein